MNRCLANCTHFEPPQRFKGTIQMSNSKIVQFHSKNIELATVNNQLCITQVQLGHALGYTRGDVVGQLFKAHADEFTPDMTCTSDLLVQGQMRKVRVFSLRGCHLLAMFSKTPVAKEFRRWVLDLIEQQNQPVTNCHQLDAKAIGGIVKNCCAVAVREELERAATDMVYADKFKQLAKAAIADVIFSEDYYGSLKKLIKPWVKDAACASLGQSIDAYIKAEMDERVKYFVEYVFKNYPKMSQGMKEYLITYGIVNYGKFSEYSREKDFKGICDAVSRQESKDPEVKYAM